MRMLITGGVGFIGTNATLYFQKKGWTVHLVDNFSRYGVKHNARLLKNLTPDVQITHQDVGATDKYLAQLKKASVILHLAGQTAVTTSIAQPQKDFTANLQGSFRLLEAVRQHNPQAIVIYASTNKVYGNLSQHQLKKDEKNKRYKDTCHPDGIGEKEQLNFISPYGCSKGAVDQYMQDYARTYNLRTVVFRQSCIYGPFQMGVEDQGWVAHFAKQFLLGRLLTVYGNGYQVRDLLFVDDLLQAYDLAIKQIDKTAGHAFNIGGGKENSYSLLQVIETLEKKIGKSIPVDFQKSRLGDQKYFVSDNRLLSSTLGWQTRTPYSTGMDRLLLWQKNQRTIL
ncbi:hypothetical protein A3F03_04185 [Candidatus Roizmanbacteria bacterium RIFCSPHIGHO2_12_FULL_41_11]|uniref:NAD-dependent epimerase/dehydratase domain-containing protein n=1 Tax=Candidatus Roizmanbacteria bacterium RIFCSPHIGHO2_12_FULL_41_11 TaxID=1802052 RepID=A0A1F7I206_9BACT|nr:MAG: hypothetical protein A3F03_04185 [Candidatus Roizmanbacteria bacterium RIFCSPHIGHO2_12_FULL_41_11]